MGYIPKSAAQNRHDVTGHGTIPKPAIAYVMHK